MLHHTCDVCGIQITMNFGLECDFNNNDDDIMPVTENKYFTSPVPANTNGTFDHTGYKVTSSFTKYNEQIEYIDDIIIGKVQPLKIFKDNSKYYKSYIPAVIDKVYNEFNSDGYEITKLKLKSDRTPIIGDIFCKRYD